MLMSRIWWMNYTYDNVIMMNYTCDNVMMPQISCVEATHMICRYNVTRMVDELHYMCDNIMMPHMYRNIV